MAANHVTLCQSMGCTVMNMAAPIHGAIHRANVDGAVANSLPIRAANCTAVTIVRNATTNA